jgi:dimethylargininase
MKRAIVRPPSTNFASGLTSVDLGSPDLNLAQAQHHAYCAALEQCGLSLTVLDPDDRFPDSTFVEDTAILTSRGAIITRPGALSRSGEIDQISNVVRGFYSDVQVIGEPGTVDGGDVCDADGHFFIGLSNRTNRVGAEQLAEFLDRLGFTSSLIDLDGVSNILHLKSGIAYLNDNRLVVIKEIAGRDEFKKYDRLVVPDGAEYAANCVEINGSVFVASGYDHFEEQLQTLGYQTMKLDMSEFQKMDGGLSCLSLRF